MLKRSNSESDKFNISGWKKRGSDFWRNAASHGTLTTGEAEEEKEILFLCSSEECGIHFVKSTQRSLTKFLGHE